MFQFPGLAPFRVTRYDPCRVSPFGYLRIFACLQLPEAFRSLPRPSSPIRAQASTVCTFSLDRQSPFAFWRRSTAGLRTRSLRRSAATSRSLALLAARVHSKSLGSRPGSADHRDSTALPRTRLLSVHRSATSFLTPRWSSPCRKRPVCTRNRHGSPKASHNYTL